MTYPIRTSLISNPKNRTYMKRKETRYLVLHETTNSTTAQRQLDAFNSHNWELSVHGFIDWQEILLTLPLDEMGWHVGFYANPYTEGYELTRAPNKEKFNKQWNMAVWWFARRLRAYGWGVDRILSHHEVSKKIGGTNHTDPDAYLAMYGKDMDDFREAVRLTKQAMETVEKLKAAGVTSDPEYWESVLSGETFPSPDYLNTLLNRLLDR